MPFLPSLAPFGVLALRLLLLGYILSPLSAIRSYSSPITGFILELLRLILSWLKLPPMFNSETPELRAESD